MLFISNAAHQKFIAHCERVLSTLEDDGSGQDDIKKELFLSEVITLQNIAEDYQRMLQELADISARYHGLQRSMRISIRKLQLERVHK